MHDIRNNARASGADHGVGTEAVIPIYYTKEEKLELLKTGKYIPQNHTSNPFNLNNFSPAPSSLKAGDKQKGATGH